MTTKCTRCRCLIPDSQTLCGYCEEHVQARIIVPERKRTILYLTASSCFILAGIGFGAHPSGAIGPILCCLGMIAVLWQATRARK